VANSDILPVASPLRAVASQLRNEFSSFDRLMNDVFADVEQVRDQLALKMAEVEDAKRRLAERGRQLADQRKESGRLSHQLEQQEARLDAAVEELRQLRGQTEQERSAAKERDERQQAMINDQLASMVAERDRLVARIRDLESRPVTALSADGAAAPSGGEESWLAVLSQLEAVRQDVLSTRTELADAVGRVSVAPVEGGGAGASPQQLAEVFAQLEQLRQEQRTLEKSHGEVLRERDRLESELELVRTRACELQELVSEQQDQLSQQHDDVSDELRQLKSVIESQLSSLQRKSQPVERFATAVAPAVAPVAANVTQPNAENSEAPPADPVVNSVMAQFARLQKDVAQRRKKK
jgi:chromosome segregation ATPase